MVSAVSLCVFAASIDYWVLEISIVHWLPFELLMMNLFDDLASAEQESLIGGAYREVDTGVSSTPNGFFRNPNAPQDVYVTGNTPGALYILNHGFYQTGSNRLDVIQGVSYVDGRGNWRQPGQSNVTLLFGDAPPLP